MTKKPAKVTLCAECKVEGPWRYDDDGNCLGKHDCATVVASPQAERDAAIAQTVDANPQQLRDALRIIHDAAKGNAQISANLLRFDMEIAQVAGPVRGAAWRQAAVNGWITRAGYVASTDAGTHAHEVKVWDSLIYRKEASA